MWYVFSFQGQATKKTAILKVIFPLNDLDTNQTLLWWSAWEVMIPDDWFTVVLFSSNVRRFGLRHKSQQNSQEYNTRYVCCCGNYCFFLFLFLFYIFLIKSVFFNLFNFHCHILRALPLAPATVLTVATTQLPASWADDTDAACVYVCINRAARNIFPLPLLQQHQHITQSAIF